MHGYQNICHEIEAVEYLNRFIVVSVHDMVVKIDARIRSGVLSMEESGIPEEVCKAFWQKHYEETNRHLFKGICDAITDNHLRIIKQYLKDLAVQYFHATGTAIDLGSHLIYPDATRSANATTPMTTRDNSVNDYAVQCDAVCDFTDFLVQQTEDLDLVLLGYNNCCKDLLNCGVPKQVCDNYVENYAKPLYNAIDHNLRAALTDAYKYLVNVYHNLIITLNDLGLSVARVPRVMSTAGYGGDALSASAAANHDVVQTALAQEGKDEQAKEQNLRELEQYLGINRGPEMSIAQADKQNANPHYWDGEEYQINCASCSLAYVLRRCFRFNVTAKGNDKSSESLNYWLSDKDNTFKVWKNIDGTPVQPTYMRQWMEKNRLEKMDAEDYKRYFDETCKDKGVYILLLSWQRGGGHATILERDEDGVLYYIEPQRYREEFSDEEGRRDIDDLVYYHGSNRLVQNPLACDGILRIDPDRILLDVEEKSFFLYDGIYRALFPIRLKLVQDDYENILGEVRKMRFTELFDTTDE